MYSTMWDSVNLQAAFQKKNIILSLIEFLDVHRIEQILLIEGIHTFTVEN